MNRHQTRWDSHQHSWRLRIDGDSRVIEECWGCDFLRWAEFFPHEIPMLYMCIDPTQTIATFHRPMTEGELEHYAAILGIDPLNTSDEMAPPKA